MSGTEQRICELFVTTYLPISLSHSTVPKGKIKKYSREKKREDIVDIEAIQLKKG